MLVTRAVLPLRCAATGLAIMWTISLVAANCAAALAGPDEMDDRITKAVEQSVAGNRTLLTDLRRDVDVVLPKLDRFLSNPDPRVRYAVLDFLHGLNRPKAVPVLTTLTMDRETDVAERAVAILFDQYKCADITAAGAPKLPTALVGHLERAPSSAKTIILLGCFSMNDAVREVLSRHQRDQQGRTKLENWLPVVAVGLAYDTALSELGDQSATARLMQAMSRGSVPDLVFVLAAGRFIHNVAVIRHIAGLLKDTRDAIPGAPSGTGYQLRVADLALQVLVQKGLANVNLLKAGPRYPDKVLNDAYSEAMKKLDSKE